jgi:uncharacterized protein
MISRIKSPRRWIQVKSGKYAFETTNERVEPLNKRKRLGITGLASIAMWAVTVAPAAAQIGGATAEVRTIRVGGVGEIRAEPDLATVQFAVETTGATAQEAGQANAAVMDRVIRALVEAGVRREDIRTSGYSLYPEYAPQPRGAEAEPPRIRGYRASNQVSVRTPDLPGVGRLIDLGLEAGANRMSGVFFELRDAQQAQSEALGRAVADARRAAETMAAALGVTLGPVLDASTQADPIRPLYRVGAADMMVRQEAAMATPIEPGEQTVRATASLVFRID